MQVDIDIMRDIFKNKLRSINIDFLEKYAVIIDMVFGFLVVPPILSAFIYKNPSEILPLALASIIFLGRSVLHAGALHVGPNKRWASWTRLGAGALGLMVWITGVAAIGMRPSFQVWPILSVALINVLAYAHTIRLSARDAALA